MHKEFLMGNAAIALGAVAMPASMLWQAIPEHHLPKCSKQLPKTDLTMST